MLVVFSTGASCSPSSTTAEGTDRIGAALSVVGESKLVAPDAAEGDQLGSSVALFGDRALVGSQFADVGGNSVQGAAYAFIRSDSSWDVEQKLIPQEGGAESLFGSQVALGRDHALIAAYGFGVYAFVRTGSGWLQRQVLQPLDPPAGELVGQSLALSGDTALVAGRFSTYVFDRVDSSWVQQPSIEQSAGALALSGTTALLGGYGEVIVLVRFGSTWTEQQRLVAADDPNADYFGRAVAISGDTAVVGSPFEGVGGPNSGAAYVFVRSGSTWALEQKIKSSDGGPYDYFGITVAVDGDMAVVGAPYHTHLGQNAGHGSAYLFVRSGTSWREDRELRASDFQNNDYFGSSLALSGNASLIGSPNDDNPFRAQGSAYLFEFGRELGDPCGAAAQCTTGFCSDGRCCDEACEGSCNACSVAAGAPREGECTLLPAGSAGSPRCAPFVCSGASPFCVVGSECGFCDRDADCGSNEYCGANRSCQTQKEQGRACEPAAGADCRTDDCRVCATGPCVDGFCCNAGCDTGCSACAAALTGAPNGTCSPVLAGTDPKASCARDGSSATCGSDGTCDGTGNCRGAAPTGTQCGEASCRDGAATESSCDGDGQCIEHTPVCSSSFVRLALGGTFSCGIRTDASLVCWGDDTYGQLDAPSGTFLEVAAGPGNACAIRTDGTLACWGSNEAGQLFPPSGTFQSVWTGPSFHYCGIRTDATVACWGRSEEGQATPPAGAFRALAMDFNTTCGIRADGTLACFGQFAAVDPPAGAFRSLAVSASSACAVRFDGTLVCWGAVQVPPPAGTYSSVAMYNGTGCALRIDGSVACWGANESGQATAPQGNAFTSVYTGSRFACAVRVNGSVPCWGANEFGQASPPQGPPG